MMRPRNSRDESGLLQRARVAREAQQELHAAFSKVVDRHNEDDPRTKRWLEAIRNFRSALARVYPDRLQDVEYGRRNIAELSSGEILDFLEDDPIFHRSGYMKPRLLVAIKKRDLEPDQISRLQDIALHIVRTRDCREFRHYCNAAAHVDGPRLRDELAQILSCEDLQMRRRARWMLAAIEKFSRSKPGS